MFNFRNINYYYNLLVFLILDWVSNHTCNSTFDYNKHKVNLSN